MQLRSTQGTREWYLRCQGSSQVAFTERCLLMQRLNRRNLLCNFSPVLVHNRIQLLQGVFLLARSAKGRQ